MHKTLSIVAVIISFIGYLLLAFQVARHEHFQLFSIYLLIFLVYIFLLKNTYCFRIRHIFFIGILFRVVFLVSMPQLSDDFYRFIWDGRLLAEGYNPYQYLPSFFQNEYSLPFLDAELYYNLNSANYFTVYPPVVQFIFLTSASVFPESIYGNVLVMKLFTLTAEIGLFYILFRIIRRVRLRQHYITIYFFNPLVIIEVVGNLHHEGLMLFFLLLGVYLLLKNKLIHSALIWALAVATKLIPLIFMPLLLKRLERKKLPLFLLVFGISSLILFVPLFDGLLQGMGESISLYFQKFEFNASIYYIVRQVGYWIKGYNIIQSAGPILGIVVFLTVLLFSYFSSNETNWFNAMTWIVTIYLGLATTVHPWYIISLICFSVFTGYIFPVLWSFLIFFTYSGYHLNGFDEQLIVILIEYSLMYALMFYELFNKENPLLHRFINANTTA